MASCSICGQKVEKTFLGKIVGTVVYKDHKKKEVCHNCQKEHAGKDLAELIK